MNYELKTNLWQTSKWQNMLKKSNQVEKTIKLSFPLTGEKKEGERDIFIEKRKISLWETALFVLWLKPENFNEDTEKKLIEVCKQENSLFLQIETFSYDWDITINSKNFKNTHFKNFITPFSLVIDLKLPEEDILKNMKPKGRYNIKLAKKKWVIAKKVEKTDENIKIFTELITETAARDNFMMNSKFDYYKTFLEELDNSELIFVYKDEKVISAWIFTFENDIAIYYYWASTSEKKYRNLMAPYLVQWEAILEWKEKWCKIYDFLWIATPGAKNDELASVSNFKLKFSKDIREVSKNYLFVNKKLKYFIMAFLRKIQKKLKK